MRRAKRARLIASCALAAPLALAEAAVSAESAGPPAVRGEAEAADLTRMSLEQLMEVPVLTVVTASRHEQKTTDAPAQSTVVTAEDIRAYGHRTLADALRSVPGLYVSSGRSYGLIGVRGFGRLGDFGGRVLLLLDGHRMNDPVYDTAAVLNDFILDVDLIERIEIVRGPGSALYGNNAFFAVVNVITRRAAGVKGGEASVEAGTWESYKGRLTYGGSMPGGTELVVSATGYRSAGNPSLYFPEYDTPEAGNGVARDGDADDARSVFAGARRGGVALQAAYVERAKDDPSPAYGSFFGESRRIFDGRGLLVARYERPIGENLAASAKLAYDRYEYWGNYPYDVADAGEPAAIVTNRDESISESFGAEVQLRWRPTGRQDLTFGAEYRNDFRERMRNFDVSPRADYLDVDRDISSFALYLQDEYRPLRSLAVTAGLRYDRFDTFGDTLNPRLAFVYRPVDATTLKLLYGTAFRAPNVNEFYYEDDGLTSKLNPDLEPERISTYELVCEQKLGRFWRGSVAGFFNAVDNLIDAAQDPADGLYYSQNIDKVETRGLEFQVEGQLARDVRGRASYTFATTEDKATGKRLDNSPGHLAKLNLTAPVVAGWLFAGAEVQYLGERTTVEGRTIDGAWLANATLFSARIRGAWDLSFSVYNLFDASYRDPAASPDTIEQDGRTLRLKLVAHY